MSVSAKDLIGGWRLERWALVHDDGRADAYPLGPDAKGIILYTPDGHVSATITRDDGSDCFAYAGRYDIGDGAVFHAIELSTNPALIGVRSTRYIDLAGERLTLSGPDFSAGTGRTQKIVWLRAR